jgi:hypothetical protein
MLQAARALHGTAGLVGRAMGLPAPPSSSRGPPHLQSSSRQIIGGIFYLELIKLCKATETKKK